MGRKLISACLLTAAVMMSAAGARADDTQYTIKLARTEKVGDKFNIKEKASADRKVVTETAGAAKTDAEIRTADLDGTLEVTAVDALNRETGMHLTIKKLTSSVGDAAAAETLPADTEIDIVCKDKQATFTQKGGELSEEAKKTLDLLFHAPTSDKSEDEMLGTTDKQKVGGTWKPNLKAMAADMSSGPMQMDPEKMSGSVALTGATTDDGKTMLEIHAFVESTDMSMEGAGKAKEANTSIAVEGQFPTKDGDTATGMKLTMKMHAIFEIPQPNAAAVKLTIDVVVRAAEDRTVIK